MTSTAERIVDQLNAYEQEHHDDPYANNPWDDVIWALAGDELDEDATHAEDPAFESKVAVFLDGSAVVWLEDERRWVVEVAQ